MLRGGIEEAFDNVRPALWLATAIVLLFIPLLAAEPVFRLDPAIIAAAENKFGGGAKERLLAWEKLVSDDASGTDLERLEKVNSFFNRIPFVSDAEHWLKNDYWATPIEFLASDGG
jgi:predicted transglutaminase-like cysteine proteinase